MESDTTIQIDQALLAKLPCGLAVIENDGRIGWANDTLGRMLGISVEELLGQSPAQLPGTARHLLEAEPRLYPVGGNDQHWVSRESYPSDDGRQLLMLTDVSAQEQLAEENARLRQQVEDLKLTDDLTGLANKRAISQALDLHVSRSRRYQNALSTVLVHIDMETPSGVQPFSTEPTILAISRLLRDRLRWVDQIARWEENLFLLVLPETNEAEARVLIEKVIAEQDSMPLPESAGELRPKLTFGLACWKKGDDMRTLLRSTVHALQEELGT